MASLSPTIERPAHVPQSAVFDFDFFHDPGLFTDPHARIAELVRQAPPLFWTPRNGGHWMAVGYQEAFRVLREPENFSSALIPPAMAGMARTPDGRRIPSMTPIMMDPPEHTRLRGPLQRTFSPKAAMRLKDEIEALAVRLVDAVAPLGRADFVAAVTEPLPVRIFLGMMGLPDDRIGEFREMVREVLAPRGTDPMREMLRMRRIADAMHETIVARRNDPRDDIISLLWSVEIEGEPMTLELMEDYCCLLFVAGLDTVINAMTYGVRHLARHPALQAELRANPDRIVEATEELLRCYSFTGPVRRVVRDIELAGRSLKAGEQVFVYLGAVDLDPREFPEPERFDLARENNAHLIFGAARTAASAPTSRGSSCRRSTRSCSSDCPNSDWTRTSGRCFIRATCCRSPRCRCAGIDRSRQPTIEGEVAMPIAFDGQVVIVTGAGQGLGRAYALELGRRGARVVVNDVAGLDDPAGSAAEAVVREIAAAGGEAIASHDTVATPEGGKAIVDLAVARFGTVDAVIHNAGTWRHKYFHEMTPDQLDPVLDVHLRGAFFVTQPAWPLMQAKGYGRIVLTSSSTGAFGRVAGTNYAAAKAAMLGLARAMSLEGEEHGIRTNCILPVAPFRNRGPVPAELTAKLNSVGLAPEEAGPELVAPMVVYLASTACSVNGEAFSAGGGRFGRVFIGVADGWLGPLDGSATAEDIEAHLPEIEDRSSYAIPPTSLDELAVIGRLRMERRG